MFEHRVSLNSSCVHTWEFTRVYLAGNIRVIIPTYCSASEEMNRVFFFLSMLGGGGEGQETLDQPISNFDVIGIPTGHWGSSFCALYENWLPSCVLSTCCPCFQWAQIVIRAQIPLLIGLKNSFPCLRRVSGYGQFVEYYFWSLMLIIGLLLLAILVRIRPHILLLLVVLALFVVLAIFAFLLGHTRTAFKEK